MNYLAAAARADARTVLADPASALTSRATRSAATTTRCCARGCSSSSTRIARRRRRRSAIACSPTARRCWKSRSPRRPASAGAASTRCCSRATRARISSWARSTPTCRCRSTPPRRAHCGTCTRVHRRLPDRRDRRAVRARRAPLHLLPHDRAAGQHSRGAAAADRQPRLRLRRLPARLPVEPLRAGRGAKPTSRVRNGLDDADARRRSSRGPKRSSTRGLAGSAIRRIGYERWLRNLAVGLGNAPCERGDRRGARARADDPSPLVREHVAWALARQQRAGACRRRSAPASGLSRQGVRSAMQPTQRIS